MLVAMALMATVLRSTLGVLPIVAGLWIVALFRARAARSQLAAREFLLDVFAMALVVIVPFLPTSPSTPAMAGMAGTSGMVGPALGAEVAAALLVTAWAVARLMMSLGAAEREYRVGSLVSGGCCALGLVAMILI